MSPDWCDCMISDWQIPHNALPLMPSPVTCFIQWPLPSYKPPQMPEKDIEAITELPNLEKLQASDQGDLKASS